MLRSIIFILFIFFSISLADSCPIGEITVEFNNYLIQATNLEVDEQEQILEQACLEFKGWVLSSDRFVISQNRLTSQNISFSKDKIAGKIQELAGTDDIKLIGVELTGQNDLFNKLPLAKGDQYKLFADQASLLSTGKISISQGKIDVFSNKTLIQRYIAQDIEISEQISAKSVFYSDGKINILADQLQINEQNSGIFGIYLSLCRDIQAKSLLVFVEQASIGSNQSIDLTNVNPQFFDWPIPLNIGYINLDFSEPIELPVRFSILDGLLIGFEGLLINKNFDLRLTLLGQKLFTPNSSVGFALNGQKNGINFSLNQVDNPLTAKISSDPASGPTLNFIIDSGWKGKQIDKPYEELSFGYAQRWQVGGLGARIKVESGELWQEKLLAFGRFSASIGLNLRSGPFIFEGFARSQVSGYITNGIYGYLQGGFSSKYRSDWLNAHLGFNLSQPFGIAPLARLAVEHFIRTNFGFEIKVKFAEPAIGYNGLNINNPKLNLELENDFYPTFSWRKQALDLSFDFSIYNGKLQIDGLGQYFQKPVFTISPHFYYDWADKVAGYRYGELGGKLTINSCCLAWSLALQRTIKEFNTNRPAEFGWKFSIGINLI